MHEQIRNVPFELKELSDDGDFVGIASAYGNIDLGNDVVDPGAFDESIKQNGNKVRLMSSHKVHIGVATVESTQFGLKAIGKINTKKQSGAEALSDLKFYRDNGMPMGMSIGYETVKAEPPSSTKDGARHLKQLRLWEVTITEFPMNTLAQVTSVKSMRDLIAAVKARRATGQKDDFNSELEEIQLYSACYQMISALSSALCDIRNDYSIEDAVTPSGDSIDQFRARYLEMLPDYRALMSADSMEWMSRTGFEHKAGRVLSQSNRDLITKCIKDLQSLLDIEDGGVAATTEKAAGPNGPTETKSESSNEDATREITASIEEIEALLK